MTFQDIFKKSFLEGWGGNDIGLKAVLMTLLVTSCLALYIFLVYRVLTRKTFYSKNFNIALVGVAVITSVIILTIQSSIVVSLGMVGALSIVRFRTAIKDPLDLMFLFWSISVGIVCGAGYAEFALTLSLTLTALIFALEYFPMAKAPMLLIINADSLEVEEQITKITKQYCRYWQIKARNVGRNRLDMTIEVRTENGKTVLEELLQLSNVTSASLLSHNGEAVF